MESVGVSGNFVLGCREEEEGRCIPKCVYYTYAQSYQAKNCRFHCGVIIVMELLQLI